jgi:LysM repeat protein
LVATANPDGSVVHVVQAGQTLWSIAATYKIALPDLLQLNGFTSSTFIYPGNKILIKPAGADVAISAATAITATVAVTETITAGTGTPGAPDSTGAATRLPRTPARSLPEIRTSTRAVAAVPPLLITTTSLAIAPPASQSHPASSGPDPLLFVVAGLVLGGTGLLVVGNVMKRGGS